MSNVQHHQLGTGGHQLPQLVAGFGADADDRAWPKGRWQPRKYPIWAVLAPRSLPSRPPVTGHSVRGDASIGVVAVCSRCGPSYDVGDAEVPRLVHLVRREGRLAGADFSRLSAHARASRMRSGAGLLGRAEARG